MRPVPKSQLCAKFVGYDLHAAVRDSAYDCYGLERLCRYLCRPALSHERLEQLDDDPVGLKLKTPLYGAIHGADRTGCLDLALATLGPSTSPSFA